MTNPTLAQLEAGAEAALVLAQKLAPLGGLFGPAGAAAGATIAHLANLGESFLEQAIGDADIIASGDLTRIRTLQASLKAENAALAAKVAAA